MSRTLRRVLLPLSVLFAFAACSSTDDSESGDDSAFPDFSEGYNGPDTGAEGAGTESGTPEGGDDASEGQADGAAEGDQDGQGDDGDATDPGDSEGGADSGGTGDPDGSGFEYECEPGEIEACITLCNTQGVRKCLKEWGPCVPLAEQCDNCEDDDCNGVVNDNCGEAKDCDPTPEVTCPIAAITISPSASADVGSTIVLSGAGSVAASGPVASWTWSVTAPAGSTSAFVPSAFVQSPSFVIDVAGEFLFALEVTDLQGTKSCVPAVKTAVGVPFPPAEPEVGCADGQREGFLDEDAYPQIAACSGGWATPGITPDTVVPTCGRKGGDDGALADGAGCSSADLCAQGWHVCEGWKEVAAKSPTGCAGATPPGAPSKSHFFAIRQPSANNIVCGDWGDGFNDVFGCGNLGVGLAPDKGCGPLDRALASTQPDTCGFNEAQPPLGPWECKGGAGSDLKEGQFITKKGCPNKSCQYDGQPVGSGDKGGVLCCRD
jgi:hypothetical protein